MVPLHHHPAQHPATGIKDGVEIIPAEHRVNWPVVDRHGPHGRTAPHLRNICGLPQNGLIGVNQSLRPAGPPMNHTRCVSLAPLSGKIVLPSPIPWHRQEPQQPSSSAREAGALPPNILQVVRVRTAQEVMAAKAIHAQRDLHPAADYTLRASPSTAKIKNILSGAA